MITVTMLGSASLMPLPDRPLSSAFLRCGGHSILFDCGEGTQSAARSAGANLMGLELLALTHYHGDHTLGIPGMLQSLGVFGREAPLYITGPAGLKEAMAPIFQLCGGLPFEVRLVETPPEGLRLDGWDREMLLTAFPTVHRVTSQGYVFTLSRPGKFLPEKAQELNIPRRHWSSLQHGEVCEDFTPDMVLGPERKGLKVVFSGDSAPCDTLSDAAKGADLFICESTFPDEKADSANQYGHFTVSQALSLCRDSGAKHAWLTHFSQMIKEPEEYTPELQEICPQIECAFAGKSIELNFEDNT